MDKVDDKLDSFFEIEPAKQEIVIDRASQLQSLSNSDDIVGDDLNYTRQNLYNVIERGNDAMEELLQVARETEHPRAYEVFGQLLDKITSANKELMSLHKQVKDINNNEIKQTNNVTNALFVGSTAELQKMLKGLNEK